MARVTRKDTTDYKYRNCLINVKRKSNTASICLFIPEFSGLVPTREI